MPDSSSARLPYRGRFAPSPTGPLHAGSLATALASWLDARAHNGRWLVRVEDLDPPREVPGAAAGIVATLTAFGLESDEAIVRQSERSAGYETAFRQLATAGRVYGCACSRRDLQLAALAQGDTSAPYPGTCSDGLRDGQPVRAWRFRLEPGVVSFTDLACGAQAQDVAAEVGDFVVRRADGLWAYQLAVVVDDAAQGITDVVRGADLLDNTARQLALQAALGLPHPRYRHVPVVVTAAGKKLSKQTGAQPLDVTHVLGELERATTHLGLPAIGATRIDTFLAAATRAWGERMALGPRPI